MAFHCVGSETSIYDDLKIALHDHKTAISKNDVGRQRGTRFAEHVVYEEQPEGIEMISVNEPVAMGLRKVASYVFLYYAKVRL